MIRGLVGGLQGPLIGWLATESDGRDIPEEETRVSSLNDQSSEQAKLRS